MERFQILISISTCAAITWGPPHRADALGLDRRGMFLRAPPVILPSGDSSGVRILLPVYHTPGAGAYTRPLFGST